MRVYVLYGQGGIITSFGMYLLANKIRSDFPEANVSTHAYTEALGIIEDLQNHDGAKVLIGFSLGANALPYIASKVPAVPIDLAVCYDPSIYGTGAKMFPTNVKRALLYHNRGASGFGHAIFEGPTVERTDVETSHVLVCYHEGLHRKTLAAISKIGE